MSPGRPSRRDIVGSTTPRSMFVSSSNSYYSSET
jgi:hypothetical protein